MRLTDKRYTYSVGIVVSTGQSSCSTFRLIGMKKSFRWIQSDARYVFTVKKKDLPGI